MESWIRPEIGEQLKKTTLTFAAACIVIGALFICWPAGTFILLCRITGLVIIVSSIALFLTSGRNQNSLYRGGYRLMAVIAFVIGLWVMLAPILMVTVFPVIVGLILLFHGVRDLMRRIREKGARDRNWYFAVFLSLVQIVLGAVLLAHPWRAARMMMVLVGIALLYLGFVGLHLYRQIKKQAPDIIDTDYTEE